jgi:hypothetical protein
MTTPDWRSWTFFLITRPNEFTGLIQLQVGIWNPVACWLPTRVRPLVRPHFLIPMARLESNSSPLHSLRAHPPPEN